MQAALTFMGAQPEVDAARLGIYGTSYGGATVVFVAAIDPGHVAANGDATLACVDAGRRRLWG